MSPAGPAGAISVKRGVEWTNWLSPSCQETSGGAVRQHHHKGETRALVLPVQRSYELSVISLLRSLHHLPVPGVARITLHEVRLRIFGNGEVGAWNSVNHAKRSLIAMFLTPFAIRVAASADGAVMFPPTLE